jgi:hypothetical protein
LLEVAEASLTKFQNFSQAKETQLKDLPDIAYQAFAVTSSSVASGIAVTMGRNLPVDEFWGVAKIEPPILFSTNQGRHDIYAKKFDKLDAELGKTYLSVWETFYGAKDSERAAMFVMRQAFDHLLRVLAPEEDVRNSQFFKRKEGSNPKGVHRNEKIQCSQ